MHDHDVTASIKGWNGHFLTGCVAPVVSVSVDILVDLEIAELLAG